MFYTKTLLFTAAAVAMGCQLASAHYDFVPGIASGQVVTGGHDDEAGSDVTSLRVGGYDFGEQPEDPYNVGDPGFNTNGASAFTGGSTLRMASLAVEGRYLSYWDGTDKASFGALPGNVSLIISGSPTRFVTLTESTATYSAASPGSLSIGTFAGNGALHAHLTSSIFLNGLQENVPVGAYLISFELTNPGGAASTSDPLFIVYNNGLDEEVHDAAIEHVESTYATAAVPEPATVGLAATAVAGLLSRRRRRA